MFMFEDRERNRSMEWSKDKTLKLIELLQVNASLWNPSLCDTRRDKQKRREELRAIAEILGISSADATKKIQHLRTQYNRESAREARANAEDPADRYISNWYAFDYLHFMKDSTKPYTVLHSDEQIEVNGCQPTHNDPNSGDSKLVLSPPTKIPRTDSVAIKPELIFSTSPNQNRDEFSVFGEYVANELRTLKGERNLLVAKKKIQDAIFEVKMGLVNEPRKETLCTVYAHANQGQTIHNGKMYSAPAMSTSSHIEPLTASHTPPTTGMSEIIINSACHYSNFKVDNQ